MTNHEQRAKELFLSGYNCAQAVFAAFAVVRLACVAVALGKADTGA